MPNEVGKTLIRRRPKFPPTDKVKTEDGVRGTLALTEDSLRPLRYRKLPFRLCLPKFPLHLRCGLYFYTEIDKLMIV